MPVFQVNYERDNNILLVHWMSFKRQIVSRGNRPIHHVVWHALLPPLNRALDRSSTGVESDDVSVSCAPGVDLLQAGQPTPFAEVTPIILAGGSVCSV